LIGSLISSANFLLLVGSIRGDFGKCSHHGRECLVGLNIMAKLVLCLNLLLL